MKFTAPLLFVAVACFQEVFTKYCKSAVTDAPTYIIVLKESLQEQELVKKKYNLEEAIKCQGGTIMGHSDIGDFHSITAKIVPGFASTLSPSSGPFRNTIGSIERDSEAHISTL